MARWEFKLPDIGEGVTEGEIVSWLIKLGEVVKEDQPMVEVMTDKATVTITSPKAGRIAELRGKVGEVVAVHSVLVVFELTNGTNATNVPNATEKPANGHHAAPAAAPKAAPLVEAKSEPAATAVGDIRDSLPGFSSFKRDNPAAPSVAKGGGAVDMAYFNAKPLATPATRKLARDLSIDLKRVPPTGEQKRVMKSDVEAFAKGASGATEGSLSSAQFGELVGAPMQAQRSSRVPTKIVAPTSAGPGAERRVPFAGIRRKIATKMQTSKQTAAHFTFVEECNVGPLKELRDRARPAAEAQGVKLNFLPFIVKAVVASLKKHPTLNCALDESTNELVYRQYYNIGIAASTDAGLIVPVVRDADRKSILEIARDIDRLATDARNGQSKAEDLSGSTFTITSLGAQGGLFATPIINFPEVGILGVHQIKKRPIVVNDEIVIGEVMLLSLSFDHRIVDGHVGAEFAYEIIGYLENPGKLFLEMA